MGGRSTRKINIQTGCGSISVQSDVMGCVVTSLMALCGDNGGGVGGDMLQQKFERKKVGVERKREKRTYLP